MGTDALDSFEDDTGYDSEENIACSPQTSEKCRPLHSSGPTRVPSMRLTKLSMSETSPGGGGMRIDNRITATAPAWCDRRSPSSQKPPTGRISSASPRGGPPGGVVRRTSAPNILAQENASSQRTLETKGDVSLCIRLRPGDGDDICVDSPSASAVRLRQPEGRKTDASETTFNCDNAFGTDATQEQVYKDAVIPICEGVIRGYNGAVIAYGQTGSGKTYTMIGNGRSKGVAPRAVDQIFNALEKRSCWTVEVSVLEIYNERVRDLLAPGSNITHVDIHEVCAKDGNTSFRCPDATTWKAANPEEALAALTEGMRRRETAKTDMNHNSSRSHLIFTLATTQTDREIGATLRGRLHLVDLAGSERLKRSMSSDRGSFKPSNGSARSPRDQRREAGEINKSLSQLALVIQRLTSSANSVLQYVPYRDSMLTRLLAESFGGSSKTCLIITCSTLTRDREESRCSLDFGRRAKLVINKAEINLEVTHEPTPVMQAMVAKEIIDLQREKLWMLQEREMLIEERARLMDKLSKAEGLTREAVGDAMSQQERRAQEVRLLEDEKAKLQKSLTDAVRATAELQDSSAAEVAQLREVQLLLHRRLVECATEISLLKQEKEAAARRYQEEVQQMKTQAAEHERQLESRANQVAALRAELQRMAQDKAAAIAKLEQDSTELRNRWLEDVSRLEQEKAAAAALGEVEKTALRLRLQQVLADLQARPQGGLDLEEASAAAMRAEHEGAHAASQSAERSALLRSKVEAATAGVAQLERLRTKRLEDLEADAIELQNRWRSTLESSPSVPDIAGPADAPSGPPANQVSRDSSPPVQSVDLLNDSLSSPIATTRCFSLDLIENATPAPQFGTSTPPGPHIDAPAAANLPRTAWTGKGLDCDRPLLSRSELVNSADPYSLKASQKLGSPS